MNDQESSGVGNEGHGSSPTAAAACANKIGKVIQIASNGSLGFVEFFMVFPFCELAINDKGALTRANRGTGMPHRTLSARPVRAHSEKLRYV